MLAIIICKIKTNLSFTPNIKSPFLVTLGICYEAYISWQCMQFLNLNVYMMLIQLLVYLDKFDSCFFITYIFFTLYYIYGEDCI